MLCGFLFLGWFRSSGLVCNERMGGHIVASCVDYEYYNAFPSFDATSKGKQGLNTANIRPSWPGGHHDLLSLA